jgi:hypothetical protein
LRKALWHGGDTHSIEDLIGSLERGEMQAHWNDSAIVITEIAQTPRRRFLHVFLSAGDKDGVLALADTLKDFARANGCEFARACIRPGFEKDLVAAGWRKKMVMIEYHSKEQQDG